MKVIILAGGCGSRLWPLSRGRYPKQFIKLYDNDKSLFQQTFERSLCLVDMDDVYIVTSQKYKFLIIGAINELGFDYNEQNIIIEPEAKSTLPAIYAGISRIDSRDECILVFSSDHNIEDNNRFIETIKNSIDLSRDYLITFGVKAQYPNTGYGYIEPGEKRLNGFLVKSFKEKPDKEMAKQYIESGYYWNAGIFMFNSDIFVEEVKNLSPEIYEAFNSSLNIDEAFSKIGMGISIDYGIMEKSSRVAVIPMEVGWSDLGSFDSFYDVFDKDENNNIVDVKTLSINSSNNLVHSYDHKMIVTLGVEDLIVIDERDALLICKKDQSQNVKEVVEELKKRGDSRTEYHLKDYRPWGDYKILEEKENKFKIKLITVIPGKQLSYQLHHHRSEHWVVVSGMAKVTIDGEIKFVSVGESIFVKAGKKHRIENPGKIPVELIEVQIGSYLEEDDIIRFDDKYGRK